MATSTKQKGRILENYVADQIQKKGIDLRARAEMSSGAGTREKGDIWTSMMILDQNVGIECKNQKVLKIQDWWRQTRKLESLGREPVLVFKIPHEQEGDTKCIIYLDTLLEIVKENMSLKAEHKYNPHGYA
jgi:hypothetical protein